MTTILTITISATVILGLLIACALLKAGADYDRNAEHDAQ
jgi:hypothetical protein